MVSKTAGLLKKRREELGWKQEYVARKLHISKALVSNLELGISSPSDDLLADYSKLLKFLILPDEELTAHRQSFSELFLSLVYADENRHSRRDALHRNQDLYESSQLFLEYWLIDYIYSASFRLPADDLEEKLKHFKRYLSETQRRYFQLYEAVRLKDQNAYAQALFLLEQLNHDGQTAYFTSMLNYHLSMAYFLCGNLLNSYQCNAAAKELFIKESNIVRHQYTLCHEANIYRRARLYNQADQIYSELLTSSRFSLTELNYNSVVSNASYNMISVGDFERSLAYLNMRTKNWKAVVQIYFNLAWTRFMQGERETLFPFLDQGIDEADDRYIADTLRIIRLLITGPESIQLEQLLEHCLQYLEKEGDVDVRLFVLQQCFEFYKRKKNRRRQIYYLERIMEVEHSCGSI